ncbi:MAG: hypothetical protein NTW21_20430 [Verrucomicrobia bacterium]|nr:hypothetical protein [Verrucomicrobiota bacterium]
MKVLLIPALACFLVAAATNVNAQTKPATPTTPASPATTTKDNAAERESEGPRRFWQTTLPGGHYMVALDHITAISRHSYVLDGALIVDEVTIDTNGQGLARFYFLRPVTEGVANNAASHLTDRAKELLDHAGQRANTNIQNMVVKKYPETTHARCIEYRLLSVEELTALYASIRSAWESGRGRVFTVK